MTRLRPRYIDVDGHLLPDCFTKEALVSAMQYQPCPEDIFVVTYPKCGTTWMCQIVLLILERGKPLIDKHSYFSRCPFIDYFGAESVEKMERPGCIKTHLPFNRLQFSDEAKYLYVARHLADCLVSYYHHTKFFPLYRFSEGTLDDFFEVFVEGEVDFGDYFDHLLPWYEQRHRPNVFFTTFEAMKADPRGTVLKVAEFLGNEHLEALLENDGQLLDEVMKYSSFEFMRKYVNDIFVDTFIRPDKNSGAIYQCMKDALEEGHESIGSFIREGRVGEGKEVLSREQLDRLTARISEKTQDSGVMSLWS